MEPEPELMESPTINTVANETLKQLLGLDAGPDGEIAVEGDVTTIYGKRGLGEVEGSFTKDEKNTEVYETLKQLLEEQGFFDVIEKRVNDLENIFREFETDFHQDLETKFQELEGNIHTIIADDFQTKKQELDLMIERKIKEELELFEILDGGSSVKTLVHSAKSKKEKKTKKKKKQTRKKPKK